MAEERLTYIKLFLDYLDAIELLGDAERGRLFTALLEYGRTGAVPQLGGNERFIFPMMRAQIDRDREAYETGRETISSARKEAGRLGGLAKSANRSKSGKSKQSVANVAKDKDKDKDKGKDKDKDEDKGKDKDKDDTPPIPPLHGAGPKLQAAFSDWLAYKQERREAYKPTGLKNLEAQVLNAAQTYGEDAVADLIRECMACNWRGIIFDRLKGRGVRETRREDTGFSTGNPFLEMLAERRESG